MCDETTPLNDSNASFVIGGTGHRSLESSSQGIAARIAEVLQLLLEQYPDRPTSLISSVAEGADRLLVEIALEHEIPWDCVLPCAPSCFRQDFATQSSLEQFERLLASARSVSRPDPPLDKESGYLWASNAVLQAADILVTVWDGGPGHGPAGTAETVARARSMGMPVIWIPSHAPYVIRRLESMG